MSFLHAILILQCKNNVKRGHGSFGQGLDPDQCCEERLRAEPWAPAGQIIVQYVQMYDFRVVESKQLQQRDVVVLRVVNLAKPSQGVTIIFNRPPFHPPAQLRILRTKNGDFGFSFSYNFIRCLTETNGRPTWN